MKIWKMSIVAAALVLACGAAWWLRSLDGVQRLHSAQTGTEDVRRAEGNSSVERKARMRALRQKRREQLNDVSQEMSRVKPEFHLEDDDYAALDDLEREIIKELQHAVDMEDFHALMTALGRMKSYGLTRAKGLGSSDWSRHVPLVMRRDAVAALGWIGTSALPELVEFLADADPDVAMDAQTQLEQALMDFELGDYDLAEVIVSLMRAVSDSSALDSYYMELSRMRNSVMISTLVAIASSGTDAAKEKLPENISFYTGDDSITTVEQAEEWLANNPDGPDDDEFYGNVPPAPKEGYYEARDPSWVPPEMRK